MPLTIQAAGFVVFRRQEDGEIEYLLMRRPRKNYYIPPKGKVQTYL